MYRQRISRKTSPLNHRTSVNRKPAPTTSFAPLSNVVQRAQQAPKSVSGDEWQALHSAIGTREVREILAGKKTPWVPEFKGIFAQLGGDSGQVDAPPIQTGEKEKEKESEGQLEQKTPRGPEFKRRSERGKEKRGQKKAPVQAKHTIGTVGEKYEREAEREMAQVEAPTQLQTANPIELNRTGMPDRLKTGLEQLSGFDLSGVRVHYNSAKPAQLNAHAYTQGQDIEVGPGQEKHLPHEAWHVVQQMQGKVRETKRVKGVALNGERELEKEAEVMGKKLSTQPINRNEKKTRQKKSQESKEETTSIHTETKIVQNLLNKSGETRY